MARGSLLLAEGLELHEVKDGEKFMFFQQSNDVDYSLAGS